jgi:hypothetical protein
VVGADQVDGLEAEEGALMPHARIFFEYQGFVYALGVVRNQERGRARVALRALNSREVSLLQPFPSIAAAQQMCHALAHAQVLAFSDHEGSQVDGLGRRKRRSMRRRRRPRILVEPVSMPVARPSAPARVAVAAAPNVPSRPMSRRTFVENRRPDPATAAELETAIDQLEAKAE